MRHDAFISYSHAADGSLAPALQRGLEQLAKPWYRMRALRIFRDETNLSASPELWKSIVDELAQARWFLLFASVEASRSKWVAREVDWWLANRGPSQLLVLLSSGELVWDEQAGDFDWSRTTALPRALSGVFEAEPHFIDMRDLRSVDALTLKHTAFRASVLKLAAPLHGRSPDEMDGEAVRAHARNRRWAGAAALGLVALTTAALWQWQQAVRARDVALSRQLAGQSTAMFERSVDTALLLAVQAWQTAQTPDARSAMLRGLQLGPISRFLPNPGGKVVGVWIDNAAHSVIVAGEEGTVVRVASDGSAPDWTYRSDQKITTMAAASDGAVLAVGRSDGKVLLLRPGQSEPIHVLEGRHTRPVTALAFSRDGRRLVSGSDSSGIAMWHVTTGAALGGIDERHNSNPVEALAFDEDGSKVFAAWEGIQAWDTASWQKLGKAGRASMYPPVIDAMVPLPGGSEFIVAAFTDKRSQLLRWPTALNSDVAAQVQQTRIENVTRVAASADGLTIALGTSGGDVTFLGVSEVSYRLHKGGVSTVALSPDGRWLVSGGEDGRVILWDRSAKPPHSGRLGPTTQGLCNFAVSPDGKRLVTGNREGELVWISSEAGRPALRVMPGPQPLGDARSQLRGITAIAFSPDGQRLAVGMGDGTVALQAVEGGRIQRARDWLAGYPIRAAAFSPDGRMLATAHPDGSIVLRDGQTGAQRSEPANIANDGAGIRALAFSEEGMRLIVQTFRKGVVSRDVGALLQASRKTFEQARAFTALAASAAMTTTFAQAGPQHKLWAFGNNRSQVELRRSDDGPPDGFPLVVEGGRELRTMVFNVDAQSLATVVDNGILLWDLRERRPIDEPLRSATGYSDIAFSTDGKFLVARPGENELEWWSTDGDEWARLLCSIANRRFTDREWASYVGGARRSDAACEGWKR